MKKSVCAWIVCTGVGRVERGFETFAKECFAALASSSVLQLSLFKGAGEIAAGEHILPSLDRNGWIAKIIGQCLGRNGYVIEQWSSFFSLIFKIRKNKPDVILYSDSNLGFLLFRFRRWINVPYKLLFSNGGPCRPPFDRCDAVQQLAPFYMKEAMEADEEIEKHYLVPYGIKVPPGPPNGDSSRREVLRKALGLPTDRPIILSVGWISRMHKRMDYLIDEVARLQEPRPFLQLLGAMDNNSVELVGYGNRLLGRNNFAVAEVANFEISNYYQAADIFVLSSLQEGFGRVYLEALMHGLPTIAHRHPVMDYVLGKEGILADLSQPGNLTKVISEQLVLLQHADEEKTARRWGSVRSRFSWDILVPQYEDMFLSVAKSALDSKKPVPFV